jgi:hypothetical protein
MVATRPVVAALSMPSAGRPSATPFHRRLIYSQERDSGTVAQTYACGHYQHDQTREHCRKCGPVDRGPVGGSWRVRQRALTNRANPKPERKNKPLQEAILLVVENQVPAESR